VAAFEAIRPQSPINKTNFDRIILGANLRDVEEILGVPPGDYTTQSSMDEEPVEDLDLLRLLLSKVKHPNVKRWFGDNAIVVVEFNGKGQLDDKWFFRVRRQAEGLVSKLRRWLF